MKATKRIYTVLRGGEEGANSISFCPTSNGLHGVLIDEIDYTQKGEMTIPDEDMPNMINFLYAFTGAKNWRKVYDDFKSHMMDKYDICIEHVNCVEKYTKDDSFIPEASIVSIIVKKTEESSINYFFSTPTLRKIYKDLLYTCMMMQSVV